MVGLLKKQIVVPNYIFLVSFYYLLVIILFGKNIKGSLIFL